MTTWSADIMDPVSLRKLKVQFCTVLSACRSKKWEIDSLAAQCGHAVKLARAESAASSTDFAPLLAKCLCRLAVLVCCTNPAGMLRIVTLVQQLDKLFNRSGLTHKASHDPTAGHRTAFAFELCVLAHGGLGSYSARTALQASAKDSRAATQLLAQVRPLLASSVVNSCRDIARQASALAPSDANEASGVALLELIGHTCSIQGDYALSTVFYELCGPLSYSSLVSAYWSSGLVSEAVALSIRCAKALDHSTADSHGLDSPTDLVHMLQYLPAATQPQASDDEDERRASWEASLPYRMACYITGSILAQYFSSGALEQVLGNGYASKAQFVSVLCPHIASFAHLVGSHTRDGSMLEPAQRPTDMLHLVQDSSNCASVNMEVVEQQASTMPLWTPMLGIHLLLRASGLCDLLLGTLLDHPGPSMPNHSAASSFPRRCIDMAMALACSAQAAVIPLRQEYTGRRMDSSVSLLTSGARSAAEMLGVSASQTLDSLPADLLLADPDGLSDAYSVGTHPGVYMCPPVISHCLTFVCEVLSVLHLRSHAASTTVLDSLRAAGMVAAVSAAEKGDRESLQALHSGLMACERACQAAGAQGASASSVPASSTQLNWRSADVSSAACKAAAARVLQAIQDTLAEGVRLAVDGDDACAVSSAEGRAGQGQPTERYTRRTPNPWIPARYKAAAALAKAKAAQQVFNAGRSSEENATSFSLPDLVIQSVQSVPATGLAPWPHTASAVKPDQLQAALHAAITDTPLIPELCLSGACSDPSIRAYIRQCTYDVDTLAEGAVRSLGRHAAHTADMSGSKQAKEKAMLRVATHTGKDDGDASTASLLEPVILLMDCCALLRSCMGESIMATNSAAAGQLGQDATSFWGTIADVILGRPPASLADCSASIQSAVSTTASGLALAITAVWTVHVKDTTAGVFSGRLLASKLGHISDTAPSGGSLDYSAALQYAVGSMSTHSSARLLTLLSIMQPYAPEEGRGDSSVAQQLMVAAAEVLSRESVYVSAVAARPLLLSLPAALDSRMAPAARQAVTKARIIVAGAKGLRVIDPAGFLPHILPAADSAHLQDEMAAEALKAHAHAYPFAPDRDILQEPLASALPLLMRDSGFRDFARTFLFLLCCGVLYTPPGITSVSSFPVHTGPALQPVQVDGIPSGLEEVLTREIDLAAYEQRQLEKSRREGRGTAEEHEHMEGGSRLSVPVFASPIMKTRTLAKMMQPSRPGTRMGAVSSAGLFSPAPAVPAALPSSASPDPGLVDTQAESNLSHRSTEPMDAKTVIRSLFSIRHSGQPAASVPENKLIGSQPSATVTSVSTVSTPTAPMIVQPQPMRSSIALSTLLQRTEAVENNEAAGLDSATSASALSGPAMFLSPMGRAPAHIASPADREDQQPLKSRIDLGALSQAVTSQQASGPQALSIPLPATSRQGKPVDGSDETPQQQLNSPGSSSSTFDPRKIPADVALAAAAQLLSAHGLRLLVATPPQDAATRGTGEMAGTNSEEDSSNTARALSPMRTTSKVVPLVVPSPQQGQIASMSAARTGSQATTPYAEHILLNSSLRTANVHLDADRPAESIPLVASAPETIAHTSHVDVSTSTVDLPSVPITGAIPAGGSGDQVVSSEGRGKGSAPPSPGIAASGARRAVHHSGHLSAAASIASSASFAPSTPPRAIGASAPGAAPSPARPPVAAAATPSRASVQHSTGTPQRPVPSVDYLVQSMTKTTRASAVGSAFGLSAAVAAGEEAARVLHAVVQPSSISLPQPPSNHRSKGASAVVLSDIHPEHAAELLQEAKRRSVARTVSGPAYVPPAPVPGQSKGETLRTFVGNSDEEEPFPPEHAYRPVSHAGTAAWQAALTQDGRTDRQRQSQGAASSAGAVVRSRDDEAAVAVAYASVGSELDRVKAQMAILHAQTESLTEIAQKVAEDWAERDVQEAQAVLQAALQRRAVNLRSMRDRVDMLLTQTTLQVAGASSPPGLGLGAGASALLEQGGPLTVSEVEQLHYALPPTKYAGDARASEQQSQRSSMRSPGRGVGGVQTRPTPLLGHTPLGTPTGGRAYTGRGPIMPTLASPGSMRAGGSTLSTPGRSATATAIDMSTMSTGMGMGMGSLARPGIALTTPPTVWAPRTARGKARSPAR